MPNLNATPYSLFLLTFLSAPIVTPVVLFFFLDVYGFAVVKTARSFINDVVYRVTYLASAPTRMFPSVNKGIASHFNLKKENEELKLVIEKYKALDLNLEYLTNENKSLKKVLTQIG